MPSTDGRRNYCTHTYAAKTPVGFETSRAEPIGLASRRLNHLAKVSRQSYDECLFLYRTTHSSSPISVRKSFPSIVLCLPMGVSLVAFTRVHVFVRCGCQGKGRVLKRHGCRKNRTRKETLVAKRSRRATISTTNQVKGLHCRISPPCTLSQSGSGNSSSS